MVPEKAVRDTMGPYLQQFERFEQEAGRHQPDWLRAMRQQALDRFGALGFPTPRDEAWRFTNVAPLASVRFGPAPEAEGALSSSVLESLGLDQVGGVRVVMVNGRLDPTLSAGAEAGLHVRSLRQACDGSLEPLKAHLARHARFADHPFRALNTAFIDDGLLVTVDDGAILAAPVHLVQVVVAAGGAVVTHPRVLVLAGENSRARIVESFVSADAGTAFTNAVTEIVVGPGGVVDHVRIQREGPGTYHIGSASAHLGRASAFSSHAVTIGGAIARLDQTAVLADEGSDCTLDGVFMADRDSLVDHHTEIDHATPHGSSHEVYKGVLAGRARGVFNGKIRVRPDAQKTDARQSNKTLLLSDEAQIHTKPELEIHANDVKCTHGATVGQLSDEQWFYLRARGIGREEARRMLVAAFAGEVVDRIPDTATRTHVARLLADRLSEMTVQGAR